MRLFIACPLPEDTVSELISIQDQMQDSGIRGTYTRPANLHITLAFIGEYEDLEAVDSVMDAVASMSLSAVACTFSGLGHFGNLWYAGVADDSSDPSHSSLAALSLAVRSALSSYSIPFDSKPFRPHITLLRRASAQPHVSLPSSPFVLSSVVLYSSSTVSGVLTYTPLQVIHLV